MLVTRKSCCERLWTKEQTRTDCTLMLVARVMDGKSYSLSVNLLISRPRKSQNKSLFHWQHVVRYQHLFNIFWSNQ